MGSTRMKPLNLIAIGDSCSHILRGTGLTAGDCVYHVNLQGNGSHGVAHSPEVVRRDQGWTECRQDVADGSPVLVPWN